MMFVCLSDACPMVVSGDYMGGGTPQTLQKKEKLPIPPPKKKSKNLYKFENYQ